MVDRDLLMGFQFPDGHTEERIIPQSQGQTLITTMWKSYHAVLKYSTFADTSHYQANVEAKREELGVAPTDIAITEFPTQTDAATLRQQQIAAGIITPDPNYISTVPTLDVQPLISEGVAQKLLDAGFSSDVVIPLTQVTTAVSKVSEVNDLMVEARSLGITPPRDILPETLIITPAEYAPSIISPSSIVKPLGIGLLLLGVVGLLVFMK